VDLAVESGKIALTVLLEAQVERAKRPLCTSRYRRRTSL